MKKNRNNGIPYYLNCSLVETININRLENESINEGIDLSYASDGIKVSYNSKHSHGINANVKDNPTTSELNVPSIKIQNDLVKVYSILQRTPMKVSIGSTDGNPLIYAFKNENGYSFKSDYDKKTIQDCIDQILKKFSIQYFNAINGNVATIICPSENSLNYTFAYAFRKATESIGKEVNIQEDALVKYPVDDIRYEIVDNPKSNLNQWLMQLSKSSAAKKRDILDKALDKMDKLHNGVFAYHFIKDLDIRKHISMTMKLTDVAKNIEDENVLVIDDTISQGQTIAEACQLLCGSYMPKTITALTLFSPLKK